MCGRPFVLGRPHFYAQIVFFSGWAEREGLRRVRAMPYPRDQMTRHDIFMADPPRRDDGTDDGFETGVVTRTRPDRKSVV